MSEFGKSQTISRLEDIRFLTGQGRYIDDAAPRDALVAVFVRSPVAHARIAAIDTAAARAMPGVAAVLTLADLEAAGVTPAMRHMTIKQPDGSAPPAAERLVLAGDRVRFVGEPLACVIAATAAEAKDAAEAVEVDYDDLPVHLDLAPGGEPLHPEAPDNVAYRWALGDAEATEAAFAAATHRVSMTSRHNRIVANAMEPRGCFAEWDGARLHFALGAQGVWLHKDALAYGLGLPPEAVRVTIPDVGGGFGMKNMPYPEYLTVAHAARTLGRPVRWLAERTESMLTDNAGRDLVTEAEIALDADLRITAYRLNILSNLGAYSSLFAQAIQSNLFARVLTGVYDIRTVHAVARGIYTNTTQVDAYRGAGRPEAITTLERLIDRAARELGVDPWELRARNYVRAFPYRTASGETYDVGDFPRVAARLAAEADLAGFAERRAASAAAGRLRGLGTCYYVESILGDPSEGAEVVFEADGTVSLLVGTQSNGQGHETVYAQFLADRTGIPVEAIRVVQGDSDRIARGGGTGGSRSVTVQTSATVATVTAMLNAFAPFAAAEMGAETAEFDGAAFRAKGSNRVMTLLEAAAAARAAGREDLLRHHERMTLPGRSFPNGAHAAEVEIDPETGAVTLARYTVTDDFGNLIHPRLVEGQVHGGIAQGAGQAIWEHTVHDETGQMLTASFMDYAMPRAADLPFIRFTTEPVPSTANVLGMKGCGEAGTVGAIAAVSNAVLDALAPRGVREVEMPFTPGRVWTWLQEAEDARAS